MLFVLLLSGCAIKNTYKVSLKETNFIQGSFDINNSFFKVIDCDTIYPNNKYELQLIQFDTANRDSEEKNMIFKLIDRQNSKEIIADSIFSLVGEVWFEDFNNDNIKDILIQNNSSARSNWTYHLYLVDTVQNKLTKIKRFEEIPNPTFNEEYNVIENLVVSGTNWTSFYAIEGDTVVNLGYTVYWDEENENSINDYNEALEQIRTKLTDHEK